MSTRTSSYRDNDPIFRADEEAVAFGRDAFNLTTGTLFTEDGDDHVSLPAVAAMEGIRNDGDFVLGETGYFAKGRQQERLGELALHFLHGDKQPPISYFTSEGGSGALMHILDYLRKEKTPYHKRQSITQSTEWPVILTRPKWPNHMPILQEHGYNNIRQVSHLTRNQTTFNIEGIVRSLRKAKRAILLLQTQPHNPTGKNPTEEHWKQLATEVDKNGHILILDSSFPGFAEGVTKDMEASRIFAERGVEHFNAVSLSKAFGIPALRTGLACHVHATDEDAKRVERDTQAIRNLGSLQLRNADTMGTYLITHALEHNPGVMRAGLAEIRKSFKEKTEELIELIPEFSVQLQGTGQFRYINGVENERVATLKQHGIFLAPVEKQKGSQGLRLNIGRLPMQRIEEFATKFRSVMLP